MDTHCSVAAFSWLNFILSIWSKGIKAIKQFSLAAIYRQNMPMSMELTSNVHRYITYVLCTFLVFAALWKGGKAIDATWLLMGITWLCAMDIVVHRKVLHKLPMLLHIGTGLLLLSSVLAFLFSLTANFGLGELLRTVSGVIALYWVAYFSQIDKKLFARIAACTAFALVAAIIIGTAVYIVQPVNRFVGSFFDYRFHTDYWPNAWGDYVLGAWPLAIWWLYTFASTKNKNKVLAFVCTVFIPGAILAALFLSYSRGSIIAFIGQLVLVNVLCISTKFPLYTKQNARRGIATMLVALGLFVGINQIRSQQHAVQSVSEKVTFTASEGAISINERQQFWVQSVELFKERPIFGWGPYSWRFIQPRLQEHVLATSDHPHNVFLKLAVERGIFASISFLFILVVATYAVCIKMFNKLLPVNEKIIVATAIVSVAGLVAHNLIDYNLQFVGILLLLWLMIGVCVQPKQAKEATMPILLAILATVFLLIALYESYYIGVSTFGRRSFATGEDAIAAQYFEDSREALFSRDLHVGLMDIYVRTNQPNKALDVFEEYRTINDQDARGWKLAADAYRLKADYITAAEYYEHSLLLSSYNDIGSTRWYIQTLKDAGRVEEIYNNRKEFDARINDFQLAIMNGVHHISLSKNVEELASLLDVMANIFPASKAQYSTLKAAITVKAQKDRDFVASRAPGLLW